jgi:hypothetical protein
LGKNTWKIPKDKSTLENIAKEDDSEACRITKVVSIYRTGETVHCQTG